jgi:hypothetical protein
MLAEGHPQGPGLDTGEDGATITSRDVGYPQKCNDVSRHLLTVSRDITRELARGLEPLTCCLQDSCATDCATPAMPGQPTHVSQSEDSGTADECRATASHDSLLARSQQCSPATYKIKFRGGRAGREVTVGYQQDAPAG